MNTEKLKRLTDITENLPIRLRESYIEKNQNSLYLEICNFCSNMPEIKFIEKIWHWVNDLENEELCKCGSKKSFNRNWRDGYKGYCSPKCAQSDQSSKDKRRETTMLKYGVDNISKLESIKDKTEITNIEKYGCKSSFQNKLVRDKYKKTIFDKWGVDHYFKTDEFKIKSKKYYLEKWGVEHQLDVEEIKDRIKKTCLDRYGHTTYLNTDHARSMIRKYNISGGESELSDWIKSLGVLVETSNRTILSPRLLDILLPDYKISIEFNGLYWHSEMFKDKKYHLNKTIGCNKKGIQMIHIWEDDWKNRKDIMKSIILNKVGLIKSRIYARNCEIKGVNNQDTSNFLNDNHIQGYTRFSDSIGLYHKGELVSLMCFGWRGTNGKREYELIRFCNKVNTIVVGASSKLFKNFTSENKIESMISYSDVSTFTGNMYEKLGFKFVHRSQPNYWWVVRGVRKHRFNFNKRKLVKMGYDPLKTEVEIMHELGNYRIWGCGQDKWVWTSNIFK